MTMYHYKKISLDEIKENNPYYEILKKTEKIEKLKWH